MNFITQYNHIKNKREKIWDTFESRSSPLEVFSLKVVLKTCNEFTGERTCQSVISITLRCNFIQTTLRHGCSPVKCGYSNFFFVSPEIQLKKCHDKKSYHQQFLPIIWHLTRPKYILFKLEHAEMHLHSKIDLS